MSKKKKDLGTYDNGIPKRLCTNCPYKKVSFGRDAWCKLYNKGNSVLGIYEWYDFPHPKCPLATMTYNKLKRLANYYRHKEGWAYYEAKKLGLAIPGYDTTQKATGQINIKEVNNMSKVQEIIKHYLDNIDILFNADTADWFEPLAEFVGTGICDGYCTKMKDSDDCVKSCELFHAMSSMKTEPTAESLNEVKSIICRILHKNLEV